jgi:hypothetical protein
MTILSDSYGNLVTVSHFAISTGDKSGFYTLRAFGTRTRHIRTEHGVESECDDASIYIRNLSTNKAQALEAAREYLTKNYPTTPFRGVVNFDLDEIHRISREESERRAAAEAARIASTDFSVFQGGKHAGKTVAEVAAEDKGYLNWFADQCFKADSDSARTQQFAKALLAPEREQAAKVASSQVETLKREIGDATFKSWQAGAGGEFLRSIANGLTQGTVPRGRGLDIVLGILAKWAGRTGSKAYNARLAELEAKFN